MKSSSTNIAILNNKANHNYLVKTMLTNNSLVYYTDQNLTR